MKHSCQELGVCQVEGALLFDLPCPQPCGECDLVVRPIVAEARTVAVEVARVAPPAYAVRFPFAPGAIEHHRPRRLLKFLLLLAVASAAAGLVAGLARGKGWL